MPGLSFAISLLVASTAVFAGTTPISVSSNYLLQELVYSPKQLTRISSQEMLKALSEGEVISIGESHAAGMERQYLAILYSDFSSVLTHTPVQCLVETGSTSTGPVPLLDMNGPNDPVRPQWARICGVGREFDNPVNDYSAILAKYTTQGKVLTHTGSRHILPFGLIYSLDFLSPQWVDIPPKGTINRQLPDNFVKTGKKLRAHVVWSIEDLLFSQIQNQLQSSLKSGTAASQVAASMGAELNHLLSSAELNFAAGEISHIYEIQRVAASFSQQRAFLSLLKHAEFSSTLLLKTLASAEFAQFLQEVDPKWIQAQVFEPSSPNESTSAGETAITEPGSIFFVGKVKSGTQTVYVIATPTVAAKLFHSNN